MRDFERAFSNRPSRSENNDAFTLHRGRACKVSGERARSRVLVIASCDHELFLRQIPAMLLKSKGSLPPQNAATNTLEACAPQKSPSSHSSIELRNSRDKAQIEIEQRRGEKNAVDQVERATNTGKKPAGIFNPGASLDDRFGKIANDRGKA